MSILVRQSMTHEALIFAIRRDCVEEALHAIVNHGAFVFPLAAWQVLRACERGVVAMFNPAVRALFDSQSYEFQMEVVLSYPSVVLVAREWVLLMLPLMSHRHVQQITSAISSAADFDEVEHVELLLAAQCRLSAMYDKPSDFVPLRAALHDYCGKYRVDVVLQRASVWNLKRACALICEINNDWPAALRWQLSVLCINDLYHFLTSAEVTGTKIHLKSLCDLIDSHILQGPSAYSGCDVDLVRARMLALILAIWARCDFSICALESYVLKDDHADALIPLLGCIINAPAKLNIAGDALYIYVYYGRATCPRNLQWRDACGFIAAV